MARTVQALILGHATLSELARDLNAHLLTRALRDYADLLAPWAQSVASYMLADVARRNLRLWKENSAAMGEVLSDELRSAPTGRIMAELMRQQVGLIQSIPGKAAERVHELAVGAMTSSARSTTLVPDIIALGPITAARAKMIARTEVSRANSNLTQSRAEYAGSEGYIWTTAGDPNVREAHKRMDGRFVRWDSPPLTDMPTPYHAGCGPNCRCTAQPVLPGESIAYARSLIRRPRKYPASYST